jgi:hypothetical protein
MILRLALIGIVYRSNDESSARRPRLPSCGSSLFILAINFGWRPHLGTNHNLRGAVQSQEYFKHTGVTYVSVIRIFAFKFWE